MGNYHLLGISYKLSRAIGKPDATAVPFLLNIFFIFSIRSLEDAQQFV